MVARLSQLILGVFLVLGAGSVVILVGLLARRRPDWLLAVFSVVIVLTPKSGALSLGTFGGRNVLGTDPVLAVAVAAAIIGVPQLHRRFRRSGVRLVALLLMIAAQAIIGFLIHSTDALLQLRGLLVLIGLSAFVLSLDDDRDLRGLVRRWLYWTAGALCVLAVQRAATGGLGNANLVQYTPDGGAITSRIENADQIVVVAAAAIQSLFEQTEKYRPAVAVRTSMFFAVVLIAQHRSVWVATAAGVGIMAARAIPWRKVVGVAIGVVFLGCLASPVIIFSSLGSTVERSLADSLSTVSATTGTGGARLNDSGQLVTRALAKGSPVVLFGSPFGTPVERFENGRLVTFNPHDAYLEIFLNLGLVGLGIVVTVLLPLMVRAWKGRGAELGLFVLFVIYSFAYPFPTQLAPVLAALFVMPERAPELVVAPIALQRQRGSLQVRRLHSPSNLPLRPGRPQAGTYSNATVSTVRL